MSRTLRSALSIAQSLPGPSRQLAPTARPTLAAFQAPSTVASSRTLFNLSNIPLPQAWRRSMKKEEEAETPKPEVEAKRETADMFDDVAKNADVKTRTKKFHEHKYKSAAHKISHRKLNQLSRQVAGLPVDEAVVQLAFGDKRAGRTWVKSTLALARDHAEAKGLRRDLLVVDETWVSKGTKIGRADIKGRGRMGIKHHPTARIHFVLREGKTWEEQQNAARKKALSKVRSAGIVREDGKLRRKVISGWAW